MSHVLMCWDIVMEGAARRREFDADLNRIAEIAAVNQWQLTLPASIDNYLIWQNKTIIITNPDQTMIMGTQNMIQMNGYKPEEVIGQTPKIFQGEATSEEEKMPIRKAIRDLMRFDSIITNYRKDGSLYKCRITGFPIFNKKKQLVNFIALENTYYERTTRK
jgi:PAS domain S-box-containing protein